MFTLETQAASAIPAENIYHMAYRVPNLLQAMEAMAKSLRVTFATPFEVDGKFEKPDGGIDHAHLRIAYTKQGPPFIEVVEFVDGDADSIFNAPAGVHHIGVYAERWRDETKRLVDLGFIHEASGSGLAFVRDPMTGIRYEIVSFRGRDFLTNILSGAIGAAQPLRETA
jgi:hypothetical protein